LLDNLVGSGAYGNILKGKLAYLVEFLPVGVWKFPACFRAVLVNTTTVVLIEKTARQSLQHIVVFLIQPQKGFNKHPWFHAQVPGYTGNVGIREQRARGFATIRTIQAICFAEYLSVQLLHHSIEIFRGSPFEPAKKAAVLLMLLLCFLRQLFEYVLHYGNAGVAMQKYHFLSGLHP
jgi:hypothetical protein